MNNLARRSSSTSHDVAQEVDSADFEKREALATDLDEEKVLGLDGAEYLELKNTIARRTHSNNGTLPHSKSLRSLHSHRSYAGGDGYTCFSDNDERPNIPVDTAGDADGEFLVTWDGDCDPENPRSMGMARRWAIVLIVSASSLCVTCTSSLYTSVYSQLIPEFHTSRLICTLGLSLFVAGLGTGPMVLSPLSEFYGRRPVYIYSYSFFLIWLIPCAVARNTTTMLVSRFLDGLAGSAFLSVAGGTVGDMFAKHELSAPMMVYTASPFIGPEIGPLVGGFIVQNTSWRWCFYVLLIWSGVQLALIVLFVPETYHPVLLRNKARWLRKETSNPRWIAPIEKLSRSITKTVLWSCIRPFQLLFWEPMCLNLCILSAILLGILYLFFGAFPLVFQNNHGFTISQVGLAFLGLFVGMLLGISSDPLWKMNYNRLVQQREVQGGEPGGTEPEFRLPPTIFGAFLVPIALFGKSLQELTAGMLLTIIPAGFGWTTYSHVHWIVPIIFSTIFGIGIIWTYSGVFTFLVDCYPLYAASALAANSFARSYFAAAFPLFGVQMYNNLGYQWASTLLAFLALVMAPFPILFYRYGKRLRGNSRFASA
ncbi:MFS general substrate transporter [Lindgomyces ingoldianus]|uniref:MFS general substrate transporter n=1 Tax=Lindgomyces ingoldianus TaxID=673940 RepID=A0ACB6R079_9PLEO|nr:MFS general substrate transporter [Lindgomyces ingoldianus]KAF2472500.1 MFS general substrate transporter [Lindgomyces ingoldianus]